MLDNPKDAWSIVSANVGDFLKPNVITETKNSFIINPISKDGNVGSITGPYCFIVDKDTEEIKFEIPFGFKVIAKYDPETFKKVDI